MSEVIAVTGRRSKSTARRRAQKRDRINLIGAVEQKVLKAGREVWAAVKDTDEVQIAFVVVAGALIGASGFVEGAVDTLLGQ